MSYEECGKHFGEEATNGCEKCAEERLDRAMLELDNFLARHFGGPGTRDVTNHFLVRFNEDGFRVTSDEAETELRATSPDAATVTEVPMEPNATR